MTNDTKTNLKPHYGSNLSQNDRNLSVNVQNSSLNDENLSLIRQSTQIITRSKKINKYLPNNRYIKRDVTGAFTHFFIKQVFTTDDNKRYYRVLSKNVSGQASRYLLAFFVPDNSSASQAVTIQSSTTLRAQLSVSREHSLISIASHLLTDYDGLTLQNKRAERRICRAVTNVTESKTRHPILLSYSVALTQKTLGGYHA
jgi:hypothetical protein